MYTKNTLSCPSLCIGSFLRNNPILKFDQSYRGYTLLQMKAQILIFNKVRNTKDLQYDGGNKQSIVGLFIYIKSNKYYEVWQMHWENLWILPQKFKFPS